MIEDHDFIMCMCRPKGRTARGEPGAAAPVARSRREIGEEFMFLKGLLQRWVLKRIYLNGGKM